MSMTALHPPKSVPVSYRLAAVAVLAVLLAQSPAAQAQLSEEVTLGAAMQAFDYGDNDLAGRYFWKLAVGGDAQAQYYLAYMLDVGLGMGRDVYQAARWYTKAAEQDFLPAIVSLGYLYSTGHGVQRDEKQAFTWYARAAQMGDAIAQNNLAAMLRAGRPYRKDPALAAQWFARAAAQGNARAQYNLATMQRGGEGVPRDLAAALSWYSFAANQGDMYAQHALASMYRDGQGIEADPDQASDWYRRAAEQGYRPAQFALARLYESGAVSGAGADAAAIWYYHAAAQGDARAQYRLAMLYESGAGLPKDIKQAQRWYESAATTQGHTPSMVALASLYERGVLGARTTALNSAVSWYQKAADLGDGPAQLALGRLYRSGTGVEMDKVEAYKWFALAAERLARGELRDQAVVERIDAVNALSPDELEDARQRVAAWSVQTFTLPKNAAASRPDQGRGDGSAAAAILPYD